MSILLNNVVYSYKGKYQTVNALKGVSYEFQAGRLYAIIGKSGSGKSTLISLMAGLDLPTGGEILVDGKSTAEWDRKALRREAVSVIYQLLTVSENICYPLTLKKISGSEAKSVAKKMRERVGLADDYDRRLPSQISGGEQQRAAIARCLAQNCKIILTDEPTGNLDSSNTQNIVEILKSLAHDDGRTVIIVTHDSAVAEQADVVLEMKDGLLQGEQSAPAV